MVEYRQFYVIQTSHDWDYRFGPHSLAILSHLEMWLVRQNKFKLENLMMIFYISEISTEQI